MAQLDSKKDTKTSEMTSWENETGWHDRTKCCETRHKERHESKQNDTYKRRWHDTKYNKTEDETRQLEVTGWYKSTWNGTKISYDTKQLVMSLGAIKRRRDNYTKWHEMTQHLSSP